MRTVILVHGFWHGSWCWSPVTAQLAARGVPSVAVDLDGHGLRTQTATAAITASSAAATLIADIGLIGGGEPCVVVAHSMAGPVVTAAAEQAPELFAHLVYVTAFAPVDGPVTEYFASAENAGEMVNRLLAPEAFAEGLMRMEAGQREAIRETFYHDVDAATADAATALLSTDAPLGIPAERLPVTRARFGTVPHSYVVCTKDNAIPVALQRRFVREIDAMSAAPTGVVELDAAHSPFLSHPAELAAAIAGVTLRS